MDNEGKHIIVENFLARETVYGRVTITPITGRVS